MSKIVIYKGVYQYDAVNIFADAMGKGFNELGYETAFIDLTDNAKLNDNLKRELSSSEFILAFGAVGFAYEMNGKSLYDLLPYPFVAVLVDHPAHHLGRLNINNIIVTAIDRSHVSFLDKYYEGSKKSAYLPHGGCVCNDPETGERTVDILFAGTYMDRNKCYSEIMEMEEIPRKIALETSEILLSNDCMPLEKALETIGKNIGMNIYDKMIFAKLSGELIPKIELFVRAEKRMKILSELDKSGLKTTIYGNNWPEGIFKKHSINGAVGFNDILKLMTRSKIVLNIGNYPDGSHERVFSAMLNGALMLSDYNSYLAEIFEEDKEIAFYRWLDLEVLPEKTAYLLSHPEKMKEIALKGKRKAEKEHTWKSRAESLLKIVNGFKAARG